MSDKQTIVRDWKAAYDAALNERDNLQHLLTKYEALETAAENFYGPSKGHRWLPGEAMAELIEDAPKLLAAAEENAKLKSESTSLRTELESLRQLWATCTHTTIY